MRELSSRKNESDPLEYVGTCNGMCRIPAVVTQFNAFLVASLNLVNLSLSLAKVLVYCFTSEN
jgi:hypothetical protein